VCIDMTKVFLDVCICPGRTMVKSLVLSSTDEAGGFLQFC
jgi:hypothetical protein